MSEALGIQVDWHSGHPSFLGRNSRLETSPVSRPFMSFLGSITQKYFNPLNPIFLTECAHLSSLEDAPVWLVRDGLVPLLWFFRTFPEPVGFTGKLLVHEEFEPFVPKAWRGCVGSYRFGALPLAHRRETLGLNGSAPQMNRLLLLGVISRSFCDLPALKQQLARAQQRMSALTGGKPFGVSLCLLSKTDPTSARPEEFEPYTAQYVLEVTRVFGSDLKVLSVYELENLEKLSGVAVAELDEKYLCADSFLMHRAIERGGVLLEEELGGEYDQYVGTQAEHGFGIRHELRAEMAEINSQRASEKHLQALQSPAHLHFPWPDWFGPWVRLMRKRIASEGLGKSDPANQSLDRLLEESGTGEIDYLFLLPWLTRGGADLGALHFIRALVELKPDYKITVMITERFPSPWVARLPKSVQLIEFGKVMADFSQVQRLSGLVRFLEQRKPRVIHNINSPLGWDVFRSHARSFARSSKLYASLFCPDYKPGGERYGYAYSHVKDCHRYLGGILVDNHAYVDELEKSLEFERMSLVPFPCTQETRIPRIRDGLRRNPRVLWAGRFDRQKRLDSLFKIAHAARDFEFHVYGEYVLDTPGTAFDTREFGALANVVLGGPFDGFEALPIEEFDAFIYTAAWDGLPNIILEATAAGLPVIAPDSGGIREFIGPETGYLTRGPECIEDYLEHLSVVRDDPEGAVKKVISAQGLLREHRSMDEFARKLQTVPGYVVS